MTQLQFMAQYFNILSVGCGIKFLTIKAEKEGDYKVLQNIKCNPYILVLKFGFNLIITALAEFCG